MLETILDRHVIFVLMGILTVAGIVSKCVVNVALKRLVRAAGNMGKSNHPLMRLVRAKFEHASMVSDKVENVRVFVDKYLYEYKILGIRLHGWRRLEKTSAGLCLIAGAAGAALEYSIHGMTDMVWQTGVAGGGLAAAVYLVHLMTDEKYQLEAAQNYMIDYLENVCRHRYEKEKNYQKEIKVLAQDGNQAEFGAMPAESQKEKYKDAQNVNVRKREPEREKSAVEVFHAAELIADEAISAFRETESRETMRKAEGTVIKDTDKDEFEKEAVQEEEHNLVREILKAEQMEPRKEAARENIVELPAAEFVRETMETSGKELAEPTRNVTRAAAQRQISTKDRQPKRERQERQEDALDKDIVIRRILEEFMA